MITSDRLGYLLDADTLERIFRSDIAVLKHLDKTPKERVWVSSITAEEMLSGALSEINKAREQSVRRDIEAPSRYFSRLIERLRVFSILSYTNAAEQEYDAYSASTKRIGKMDCRLAAHAMTMGFTVVTCNTADFERIPGVKFEDWSKA
jgi:tRNA(fMet)-specific endonuclease VapC